MNPIFVVTGFTLPHPPSVCTAITSAAQLLSGVVQALMQPQLWGNLNAEDDNDKVRDGKALLITVFGIVFTLLLIVGSGTYVYINTAQTPPRMCFFFFFFFLLCLHNVSALIFRIFFHKVRKNWWALHLWCPWGVLPVRPAGPTGFSNQPLESNKIFPYRDPAGISAACVVSRLGQCIFFTSVTCERKKNYTEKLLWRWTLQRFLISSPHVGWNGKLKSYK